MSDQPATGAAPPTEEPKADAQTHEHPDNSGAETEDTPPEAEAAVERLNEPAMREEPEPAPAPPPELAEPEVAQQDGVPHAVPTAQPVEEEAHEDAPVLSGLGQPTPHGGETTPEPVAEENTVAPETVPVPEPGSGDQQAARHALAGHAEEDEKPAAKPKRPRKKAEAASDEVAVPAASETPAEPAAEGELPAESNKKWYAIKVQSGREESIKSAILRKVAIEGLEEYLARVEIPVEEIVEKKQVRVKDKKTGEYTYQEKKVTKKRKKFHGYIFAELEFNDRILYLFRETSGVGDFLNMRGKPPVPEPMPEHEVQSMLTGVSVKDPTKKQAKVKLDFEKGDRVRIRDGSFANQEGEVKAISEPKDPTDSPKVKVELTFWGRPLEVELEYYQVDKV